MTFLQHHHEQTNGDTPRTSPAIHHAALFVATFLTSTIGVTSAWATQPMPESDLVSQPLVTGPRGGGDVTWPTGRVSYIYEFAQLAAFMDTWQVKTPGANFGGMIEAEAGDLGGVVQTDNTLEAIWVWSRYMALTDRGDYIQNINDAWTYCTNFPAWNEEGGTAGYYRVHNCAWGLTAESAYRALTGNTDRLTYATTCADWIVNHPLFINQNQKINAFVEGWAAGNLYLYGEERNNTGWKNAALGFGTTVQSFIAANPAQNLSLETWAMSSGTMVWGLCNSSFRADPVAGQQWIQDNGALVDTFQTWYDVPNDSFDWDNSWNVAYLNAHAAMSEVTGSSASFDHAANLTRLLLSYDSDDDGGIQATTQDPVTEDMSWVSCYLTKFGVNRLIGTPASFDAGVLRFVGLDDGDQLSFPFGSPLPIQVEVSNFGLNDLSGVEVHLTGPVSGDAVVDLSYVEKETLTLNAGWSPGSPGDYSFVAYVVYPGDGDASNDSLTITVHVSDPAAVDPREVASLLLDAPRPNPFNASTEVALSVPADQAARLAVFAADGRRVASFALPAGAARIERWSWDGRDSRGARVPNGSYFLRARAGSMTSVARLVLTR